MNNMLEPRISRRQKKAMELTGAIPVLLFLILVELIKLLIRLLKRFWRWITRLLITTAVVFFLTAFFMPVVYSPYADASHIQVTPTPTPSELENIVAYIARVFEPEGKDVVVRAINCFYSESGLRSKAHGINSDKEQSEDWGVAQLNDYWHTLTPEQKTEIKANIDKAYEIYKRNGRTFNPWYGKLCN